MKKLVILCILSLVSVSIFAQIRRAHSVIRRGLYGQYDNAVAITLAGGNSYYFFEQFKISVQLLCGR